MSDTRPRRSLAKPSHRFFVWARYGRGATRHCQAGRQKRSPSKKKVKKPKKRRGSGGIIDALIQEEIVKFTSLDDLEDPLDVGAKPLNPQDISVAEPLESGGFCRPQGLGQRPGR